MISAVDLNHRFEGLYVSTKITLCLLATLSMVSVYNERYLLISTPSGKSNFSDKSCNAVGETRAS